MCNKENEICQEILLRTNKFILDEIEKNFSNPDDRIPADLVIRIALLESSLKAFEQVTGVKYAKVVRLKV